MSGYTTNQGLTPVQNIPPSAANPFGGYEAPVSMTQEQALKYRQMIIDADKKNSDAYLEYQKKLQMLLPPIDTSNEKAKITVVQQTNKDSNSNTYLIIGACILGGFLLMKK